MKRTISIITAIASASLILTSCGAPKRNDTRIRVIETTDIHGYFTETIGSDDTKTQFRLARIAKAVDDARASEDYDDVLLLDGGDLYQGPPESTMTYGDPVRAAFDAMNYDAVALGNHEFDWGIEHTTDKEGTLPPYEVGSYKGDPDIPILASNLYEKETNERVDFTQDYTIVEKAGKKIAIVGYLPNYIPGRESVHNDPYYIDDDLGKFSEKVAGINQKENPDVTVVLTHADPVDVTPGLDPKEVQLVAGGHSHRIATGRSGNGIAYVQADCHGSGYATATIVIAEDGTVTVEDPMFNHTAQKKDTLYDKPGNEDNFDATVLDISREALDEHERRLGESLGYTEVSIDKNEITGDNGSSVSGNFITGLMLQATKDQDTVAAFFNNGGIMANFKLGSGETKREITGSDIYELFRFNNRWLVFDLTGAELKEHITNALTASNFGDQMSGLTFEYKNNGTDRQPEYEVVSITLNDGTKVDINDTSKTYRVCITNYSAGLKGSIFEGKTPIVPEDEAPIDNVSAIDVLREQSAANGGLIPVDRGARGTLVK